MKRILLLCCTMMFGLSSLLASVQDGKLEHFIMTLKAYDTKAAIDLMDNGFNLEHADEDGRTAIFHAVLQYNDEVVSELVRREVRIDKKDALGNYPLDYAPGEFSRIGRILSVAGGKSQKTSWLTERSYSPKKRLSDQEIDEMWDKMLDNYYDFDGSENDPQSEEVMDREIRHIVIHENLETEHERQSQRLKDIIKKADQVLNLEIEEEVAEPSHEEAAAMLFQQSKNDLMSRMEALRDGSLKVADQVTMEEIDAIQLACKVILKAGILDDMPAKEKGIATELCQAALKAITKAKKKNNSAREIAIKTFDAMDTVAKKHNVQ